MGLLVVPFRVSAHEAGLARIGVTAPTTEAVTIELDGRLADIRQVLSLPERGPLPSRVLDRALPDALPGWLVVSADGAPCMLSLDRWAPLDGLALRLGITARCPARPVDLTIEWPGSETGKLKWAALLVIEGVGDGAPLVLDAGFSSATVRVGEPPPPHTIALRFARLGIEHILIGWDHLAFLLALMLGCGRLRQLVAVVTAFTVAHSVTLGLGATGVVTLPGALVESLIALSIAVAAGWGAIRLRRGILNHPGAPDRGQADVFASTALCFGFGLMHGFGFAGLLADLLPVGGDRLWPLVGFNLGVEAGQLLCVLIAMPALVAIGRSRWARPVFGGLLGVLIILGLVVTVLRIL